MPLLLDVPLDERAAVQKILGDLTPLLEHCLRDGSALDRDPRRFCFHPFAWRLDVLDQSRCKQILMKSCPVLRVCLGSQPPPHGLFQLLKLLSLAYVQLIQDRTECALENNSSKSTLPICICTSGEG